MQHTVFSVEPQSGRATNHPTVTDTQTLLATESAEQFSSVFVEPVTSAPDVRTADAYGTPALAETPDVLTVPQDGDSPVPGLVSNNVSVRGVRAMQVLEDADALRVQPKSAQHPPIAIGDALDPPQLSSTVARNLNAAQNPAVANNAVPILRAAQVSSVAAAETLARPDTANAVPIDAPKHDDLSQPVPQGRHSVAESKDPILPQGNYSRPGRANMAQRGETAQNVKAQQSIGGASASISEAPKSRQPHPALPHNESPASEVSALPLKPDPTKGMPQRTDGGRLRPPPPQGLDFANRIRPAQRDVAPTHETLTLPNSSVRAPVISHPAVSSNDARPISQRAVGPENSPFPDKSAAKVDASRPVNSVTAKSDQKAAPIQSATTSAQSEYTVEYIGRQVDRRPALSAELEARANALPLDTPPTREFRISASHIDAPLVPKPAVSERAATLSPPQKSLALPDPQIQPSSAPPQPTKTIAAGASIATPLSASVPPIALGLPKDLALTPGKEGLDSIEQALAANGADPSSRETHASVVDVLRRLDAGMGRMELARSIATQIGDAARASVDGTIEVRLSPMELGRVRLSMRQSELGLTVTVVAERAETMDLIRRNTDLFAQDLRNLGHQNIAFSFDQDAERQPADGPSGGADVTAEGSAADPDSMKQDARASRVAENGRLDIRL